LLERFESDKFSELSERITQKSNKKPTYFLTLGVFLIIIFSGGPKINPTVIDEVSWDVAESVEQGNYAIDMRTAFMGDISGPDTNFVSASTVVSKWGVGDSDLASWKCSTNSFSIIITDTDKSDEDVREWLDVAISEDSRRWSLEQFGENWENWVSVPAVEIGSIEMVIGDGDLELFWNTNFSHKWYEIELDTMKNNVSLNVGNYVILEDSNWKACNPDLGVVSPQISYVTEVDN